MRNSILLMAYILVLSSVQQVALAQSNEYEGTPVSTTVFVTFDSGGVAFRPSADGAATLAGAKGAALVAIRGRTSTDIPTAKDEALALARATAARSYLISRGVSPLKTTLNYASGADFVTDNETAAGRHQNQRVEIDLVYVPTFQDKE